MATRRLIQVFVIEPEAVCRVVGLPSVKLMMIGGKQFGYVEMKSAIAVLANVIAPFIGVLPPEVGSNQIGKRTRVVFDRPPPAWRRLARSRPRGAHEVQACGRQALATGSRFGLYIRFIGSLLHRAGSFSVG